MSAGQENDVTVVRLDRASESKIGESPECHVTEGPFKGIVVKQTVDEKGRLPPVGNPNVRTWFFAHTRDKNTDLENATYSRERREICFWFRRKASKSDQISQTTKYFKSLIEPEHFPKDYVSFIKKSMLLMQEFPLMRRVQLSVRPEPDTEGDYDGFSLRPEAEDEEPPIENFITVLTPAVYDYQYLPEVPVSRKNHVTFRIMASAEAHVALSHVYGDTDRRTYEIVLGGWNNTKSAIRYGGRGPIEVEANTPGLLNAEDFQAFWIMWSDDRGSLEVGRGMTRGLNCILRWPKIPPAKQHSINLMSVSTGPGSQGRWEFIEYLSAVTKVSETKASKRAKVRRGVVWYAKKTKMLENLEAAFPSCINTQQLLSISSVRLTDMLEAVVFLKDLLKLGLALEVARGVWLRSPTHHLDIAHEIKMVSEMPRLIGREAPTVALVTVLYCDKQAMDTMMDDKVSYVVHSVDSTGNSKSTVYTVGRIGDHKVVAMKLRKIAIQGSTKASHAKAIEQLIGIFDQLQHVLIVTTGGAVPNYTEYDKHLKRGDVAVSVPKTADGPMYVHCSDVDLGPAGGGGGGGGGGDQAFFSTSVWNSADDTIAKVARQMYDVSVSRGGHEVLRSWEKYSESGQEQLRSIDDRFHRPPGKTDRLYAVLEGERDPVLVRHPVPPPEKRYAYRESTPNVRLGPIGCGRAVSRSDGLRMEFANCHGVIAYDRGLHHVVEAVMNSRVSSLGLVLGICDYLDGTKTRTWQPYAAVCAASFAKSLVLGLPVFGRRRGYYQ